MNIVQINLVYGYSSTGRTAMEMHRSLINRGFNSFVFCSYTIKNDENVFTIGSKTDHKIHALFSRLFGKQAYFSHLATNNLVKHLNEIAPDIIILRNLHGNYINLKILMNYLSEKQIPVINVLHDCWSFTGHCCYYTEDHCQKWQTECDKCPILFKYNTSLFFDNSRQIFNDKKRYFSSLKSLAVVGVSKWVANEASQSPIFQNASIITHVYNWIDMNVFKPNDSNKTRSKLSMHSDDFVVLGVAQNWTERKGLYQFINYANKLQDIKFVLVGNMPSTIKLPKNLMSIAPTNSPDELADYYSMADVFINFSTQETFGKVTAEALACGTPIIVNNATATPELCGDGCGYVVENNNEYAILNYINAVREKGKSYYSAVCRSFAVKNFDKEAAIDEYIEIFNRLIKHNKI